MSIWSELATELGGRLAGTVGNELINRLQTRLRGDNPQSAFFDWGDEPFMMEGLPELVGAGAQLVGGLVGGNGKKKRRRINSTNVHALRRALRRVESFVKVEKRVDKIVNRVGRASGRARRHGFVRGGAAARRAPGTGAVINIDND